MIHGCHIAVHGIGKAAFDADFIGQNRAERSTPQHIIHHHAGIIARIINRQTRLCEGDGALGHIHINHNSAARCFASKVWDFVGCARLRQFAENLIQHGTQFCGCDRANNADFQLIARQGVGHIGLHIRHSDIGNAGQRAFIRATIGVILKNRFRHRLASNRGRIRLGLFQTDQYLGTHPFDRLFIKARLCQSQGQKLNRLFSITVKCIETA